MSSYTTFDSHNLAEMLLEARGILVERMEAKNVDAERLTRELEDLDHLIDSEYEKRLAEFEAADNDWHVRLDEWRKAKAEYHKTWRSWFGSFSVEYPKLHGIEYPDREYPPTYKGIRENWLGTLFDIAALSGKILRLDDLLVLTKSQNSVVVCSSDLAFLRGIDCELTRKA